MDQRFDCLRRLQRLDVFPGRKRAFILTLLQQLDFTFHLLVLLLLPGEFLPDLGVIFLKLLHQLVIVHGGVQRQSLGWRLLQKWLLFSLRLYRLALVDIAILTWSTNQWQALLGIAQAVPAHQADGLYR